MKSGWIGVDLDGTLAKYDKWRGTQNIGEPVTAMVDRVKAWISGGIEVKIFTARMAGHGKPIIGGGVEDVVTPIQDWCRKHLGQALEVTNVKDFGMLELWDDRAIQVEVNTGRIATFTPADPISKPCSSCQKPTTFRFKGMPLCQACHFYACYSQPLEEERRAKEEKITQ